MDSFAMLNEEVFKHLCSLAIDKVSDKTERRKAGCGGMAMRKRLLIKNFVNDLCRKKDEQAEEKSSENRTPEDYESIYVQNHEIDRDVDTVSCEFEKSRSCSDFSDEDFEDGVVMAEDEEMTSAHDIWLDSAAVPDNARVSDSLIFESTHPGREGAIGRLGVKSSETRLSIYSFYSSVSESADDGDETLSACDPTESLLPNCLYDDCTQTETFESAPLTSLSNVTNLSSICYTSNSCIQPVLAEESDQIFLSLSNHKYSDLKTYNPEPCLSSLPPPLIDDPLHCCSAATKRRSNDFLLYDSISADVGYQKKIKL